jgi:tol-pal system protein YbgF
VAEHRKLERQVIDLQRGKGTTSGRERLADLAAELDELTTRLRELNGKLEEVDQVAERALREAQRARREAARGSADDSMAGESDGDAALLGAGGAATAGSSLAGSTPGTNSASGGDAGQSMSLGTPIVPADEDLGNDPTAAVRAYKEALSSWRNNDYAACIDRFRGFLQTYASSSRADDAAFWVGDCHYRQGEFKNAVVRFDDVVRNYPTGNRAPDALYRQGESLLKLGPTFHPAARRAFERVLKEYPDSARAVEAGRQLELRSPG